MRYEINYYTEQDCWVLEDTRDNKRLGFDTHQQALLAFEVIALWNGARKHVIERNREYLTLSIEEQRIF